MIINMLNAELFTINVNQLEENIIFIPMTRVTLRLVSKYNFTIDFINVTQPVVTSGYLNNMIHYSLLPRTNWWIYRISILPCGVT